MINKNELPKNWEVKELKEVCQAVTGTTPPKTDKSNYGNDVPFVKPPQIFDRPISDAPEKLSFKGSEKARILPAFSVLVTCIGNLGRTAINKVPVAFNQQINALLPTPKLNSYYLFYQAQSPLFRKQLDELSSATTVAIVNKGKFETIKIPLPPLAEQERIVAKIEELFSELDAGLESLKTAQTQLKTYRQAVLKYAFEGKLTNDNVTEGELPADWEITNLGELKEFSIYGPRFSSKDYTSEGVAVLRTTDISERGKVDWVNSPKLNLDEKDYEKYKLIKNDLLITRTGSIGTLSIFNDEKRAIPGAFLIHYRLKKNINIWYIFYFLKSQKAQKHFKDHSFGVGRPNLNVPNIELLEIPVCTLEEQQHIVEEIESRLSVCDKFEETIAASLAQSEALRQSILKMAFEGKLVPQDENDELASVLLERIKEEREAFLEEQKLQKKKTTKKKKSKTMAEELKSILKLLEEKGEPINAQTLWQSSEHKDDIDEFYAEVKKLVDEGKIKETDREGKDSFLEAV